MKTMTTADATSRVEAIRVCRFDFEAAHGMEDELRADVLREVVRKNPRSVRLAEIALSTDSIPFQRCGA